MSVIGPISKRRGRRLDGLIAFPMVDGRGPSVGSRGHKIRHFHDGMARNIFCRPVNQHAFQNGT